MRVKGNRSQSVKKELPYARHGRRRDGKKRVLLVDDHPAIRLGLVEIINREPDLEVCGQADGPVKALEMIGELKPDLVSTDLTLGDYDGVKLIESIRSLYPEVLVVAFSMHEEASYQRRALHAGALAYLKKRDASEKIVPTIRELFKNS